MKHILYNVISLMIITLIRPSIIIKNSLKLPIFAIINDISNHSIMKDCLSWQYHNYASQMKNSRNSNVSMSKIIVKSNYSFELKP